MKRLTLPQICRWFEVNFAYFRNIQTQNFSFPQNSAAERDFINLERYWRNFISQVLMETGCFETVGRGPYWQMKLEIDRSAPILPKDIFA